MSSVPFRLAALLALVVGCTPMGTGGDPPADAGDDDDDGQCATGGGEASVGACLVAQYAGTYDVTATSGTHARGTVTIADDGAVDYDEGLSFSIDEYQGVYDRLECCMRISVEMNPRADNDAAVADARHRVDVFTDSATTGGAVTSFEYYPNWPSETGKVVLDVQ